MSKRIALLFLGVVFGFPRTSADVPAFDMSRTVACVVNYDGVCAGTFNNLVTEADVANMATSINANIAGCSTFAHPVPGYFDRFKLPNSLAVKTIRLPCTSYFSETATELVSKDVYVSGVGKGFNGADLYPRCVLDGSSTMPPAADPIGCRFLALYSVTACAHAFGIQTGDLKYLVNVFNVPVRDAAAYSSPVAYDYAYDADTVASVVYGSERLKGPIPMDYANRAGTWLHEIGHLWGLEHSQALSMEYGDCSDLMGCSDSTFDCFHAASRNMLGWATSIGQPLEFASQPKNTWLPFAIPEVTSAFKSHVIVAASHQDRKYFVFLSYRASPRPGSPPSPYDKSTPQKKNLKSWNGATISAINTVSVHIARNSPVSGDRPSSSTFLLDTIATGSTWDSQPVSGTFASGAEFFSLSGSKFAVKNLGSSPGAPEGASASILVCFYVSSPSNCNVVKEGFVDGNDGRRNDANATVAVAVPDLVTQFYTTAGVLRNLPGVSGWQRQQ